VYSRAYRTALIITTTLTLMFINALLYDKAYPSMGCEDIEDEVLCLSTPSPLSQGSGACIFDPIAGKKRVPPSNGNCSLLSTCLLVCDHTKNGYDLFLAGTCRSAEREGNFYSQIVIAVVSAIFSTPLNLLLKLIFERSILPPIKVWASWAYSDLTNKR
jgi:hypothetical protein